MGRILLAILLALALIFAHTVTEPIAHEMTQISGETSESGAPFGGIVVMNLQGEEIGKITDVVAGPEGRSAFVILSYEVSDDTRKEIAVPFGALSCTEQSCILNASREELDSAPFFVSKDDLAEPVTAEDIYRYFGVQPYWAEEGTEK
jgi:hypothetical protein